MKLLKSQKTKVFFKKLTATLLAIIICVGFVASGESGAFLNGVLAIGSAYCDEALGTVTESTANGKTTLTAVPYANVGFRGWYCNGKEVSLSDTVTVDSALASSYYAEFYNFNLIKNGSFEDYEAGQDLKLLSGDDRWQTVAKTSSEVTEASVSGNIASNGNKSLKIKNQGATYRKIAGLIKDTYYTLSFSYSLNNTADYLNFVCLLPTDMDITATANMGGNPIDYKKLNSATGATAAGSWNEVKFTFNSGENTEINLCFNYASSSNDYIYIDNLMLVMDCVSSPTDGNYDFENNSTNGWAVADAQRAALSVAISEGNYSLSVKNKTEYGLAYSEPYKIQSGYTYTFSYALDLSGVSDNSVALNFGLSTVAGSSSTLTLGADGTTIEGYTGAYCDTTTSGTGCTKTISNGSRTITLDNKYCSGDRFTKNDLLKKLMFSNNNLTITTTFTANKDCTAYIYFRLDGAATYYIDNVKVTRTAPENVSKMLTADSFKPIGTAIRLNGKQGIRHKTRIDKKLLTANNEYGIRAIEYGTVAVKADALGAEELVIDGKYTLNDEVHTARTGVAYSFEKGINKVFAESDYYIDFTGVLINISEDNYLSDYAVRSYLKYYDESGALNVIYTETYRPSIYDVAKEAYSAKNKDGSFTETNSDREYLYNSVLSLATDRTITIGNASNPINTDFEGVTSTVYHCFTFMDDPIHGRTYTEEQAAIEMDRLKDSGITSVRTIFKSSFAAGNLNETYQTVNVNGTNTQVKTNETFDGWDWNTPEMKAFYKWAKMLQDRDIDIILNAGWNIPFFITRVSSIPEIYYLLGYEEGYSDSDTYGVEIAYGYADKYNESAKYNFTGNETFDERRMIIASLRYGEWMRQALEACEANGVYNVKYLLAYTEPGRKDDPNQDEIDPYFCYPQWTRLVQGLHDALKEAGIRDKYRIIGPNQSIYRDQNRPVSFLDYYLDFEKANPEYEGMVDILSSHIYAKPLNSETSIYDPYGCYDRAEDNFTYFKEILEENGAADRAFWCDEYNAGARDCDLGGGLAMQMTQFAAGFTSAMNNGVDNIISWQIFDQLWTPQFSTGGEFVGGVHVCGTCPSFATIGDTCTKAYCACRDYAKYASYTPRVTYYGLNLLGKYMSAKSGSVYNTTVTGNEKGGIYASSMRDQNGNLVVLAVNTLGTATNVTFNLEKANDYSKITRYTYNPEGITPTEAAVSIPSDGTINYNGNSFYDVVPAQSFSIYVYEVDNAGDVFIPID